MEVDRPLTQLLYNNITVTDAEECNCSNCSYFIEIKDRLYPLEIKQLFEELGVDLAKEAELTDYGDEEHLYGGCFQFAGKLISGKDCSTPVKNNQFIFELEAITDSFEIGFSRRVSDTYFNATQVDLIEMVFMIRTPLTIDRIN